MLTDWISARSGILPGSGIHTPLPRHAFHALFYCCQSVFKSKTGSARMSLGQ